MSKWIGYLLLLGIILPGKEVFSQRLGLLPSKTKWHQLCHDSLRVIYPAGQEETATRVASLMLKLAAAEPIAKDSRYKPIDVILQPHTNISNGYVGLAPYVSEFYLQPNENPFELGSLPWADLLALHEYRHVQQVNAMNTGISHLVKVILGERAYLGMVGLASSNWFREGDAVSMETKYTLQGRGRLSRFTLPFRERVKNEKPWNYYVLRNGSYKKYTPDHYPLGYLMIQFGNHVFGEATWDSIFRETPRMKPIYDPFSGVMKRYFGKSNRFLYLGAMEYFGAQWKAKEVEDIRYPAIPINEKALNDAYFDMSYPDVAADGSIYCVITSFDSISTIYKISPDGTRKKIKSLGLQQDTYFDQRNDKLVWTELRYNPRWVRKDKNVIVLYDEKKKRKKTIIPDKGYYTPSLDATGNRIVAQHTDDKGNYTFHLIDAVSGKVLDTLPNPGNLYLGYPSFDENAGEIIATARRADGRMCLVSQNIESGVISYLTHYSYAILGRPVQAGPWIFVTSSLGELDQVYAVDKQEGIYYQISGGNSAHYDPAWDPVQEEIVASEYHLKGRKLVRLPGLAHQWRMTNPDEGIKQVPGYEEKNILAESDRDDGFEVKKYSPWSNALNFHSWSLRADDPVWALELLSDDIMQNLSMAAGYEYNRNNKIHGPYVNVRLGMWFPEILLGYSNIRRNVRDEEGNDLRSINEELYTGLAIPLLFTPGVYSQVLNVSTTFHGGVNKIRPEQPEERDLRYYYNTYRILLTNSKRKAYRQPTPSWAQSLDMSYTHNVAEYPIRQFYSSVQMALPSFKPSNYIIVVSEYLSQGLDVGYIRLNSRYAGARGFDIPDGETNYRFGITYGFPLLYPDVGLGNIAYMRRIRLQPFFDYAYADYPQAVSNTVSSAGAELLLDFEFENITIGLRYIRLLSGYDGSPHRFEFFIPSQRF